MKNGNKQEVDNKGGNLKMNQKQKKTRKEESKEINTKLRQGRGKQVMQKGETTKNMQKTRNDNLKYVNLLEI